MSREDDRQQLPASLRRDVRLLADLLGEVIRDTGGQDLLDDVEKLRRAVIAARAAAQDTGGGAGPGGDGIAALVAGWPLDRAELVAKAFTVYFHLTNLAEERQRVRVLTGQDPEEGHRRESLAAAVAQITAGPGEHTLGNLLGQLRVHPVLTAHPTEARRRAVAAALRRIARPRRGARHRAPRGRPGGGPAPAARGDRTALADRAAAGQAHRPG